MVEGLAVDVVDDSDVDVVNGDFAFGGVVKVVFIVSADRGDPEGRCGGFDVVEDAFGDPDLSEVGLSLKLDDVSLKTPFPGMWAYF